MPWQERFREFTQSWGFYQGLSCGKKIDVWLTLKPKSACSQSWIPEFLYFWCLWSLFGSTRVKGEDETVLIKGYLGICYFKLLISSYSLLNGGQKTWEHSVSELIKIRNARVDQETKKWWGNIPQSCAHGLHCWLCVNTHAHGCVGLLSCEPVQFVCWCLQKFLDPSLVALFSFSAWSMRCFSWSVQLCAVQRR